jgi:BMFP domain-containing protein YqiC
MADPTPQFVLVMSVSPYNDGNFGRAGLRFTRAWRPLEVARTADLEKGVIDYAILDRLQAESFLAVKPATPEEVAQLAQDRAEGAKDKDSELAELRGKNAQLEARLMRLEVAKSGPDATELAELRAKNADLEARLAGFGELEARLMRLENSATAPMAPPSTDVKPSKSPASGK